MRPSPALRMTLLLSSLLLLLQLFLSLRPAPSPLLLSLDPDTDDYVQDETPSEHWVERGARLGEDFDFAEDEEGEDSLNPMQSALRQRCEREKTKVVKLLFPHVNKAGGRTVEGTFDSIKLDEDTFRFLTKRARSNRVKFYLVDGHADFGEIGAIQEERGPNTPGEVCARWVFMMRDPIARTLSAFNTKVGRKFSDVSTKASRTIDHFLCSSEVITDLMKNPKFSFEDFARLPKDMRETCNTMNANLHTRYIAGLSLDLEIAKRRLRRFAFVGMAEQFPVSMQLLNWQLDLDLKMYTPIFNWNPHEAALNLSARAYEVLREMNDKDIALHKFAREELFEPRINAMKSAYRGGFPWGENVPPAKCDPNVICWSKERVLVDSKGDDKDDVFWKEHEQPPGWIKKYYRDEQVHTGAMKRNILCAPANGCVLSPWKTVGSLPSLPPLLPLTVSLPPSPPPSPPTSVDNTTRHTSKVTSEPTAATAEQSSPPNRPALTAPLLPLPLETPDKSECVASFFIVGARKGGTTSLYQYLSEHPNVHGILLDRGPMAGETFFFQMKAQPVDAPHALPTSTLRDLYDAVYYRHFRKTNKSGIVPNVLDKTFFMTGESSVGMGPSCNTPRVLKEACGPKAKIIYLLRDPTERMYSQYQMRIRLNRGPVEANFTLDAKQYLSKIKSHEQYPELLEWLKRGDFSKNSPPPPCLFVSDVKNAIWSGMYVVHLARWFKHFPRENIMVVQSEKFFANPKQTFLDSMKLLGLSADRVDAHAITKQVFNAAPKKQEFEDDEIIAELRGFFRPWNEALEKWRLDPDQNRVLPMDLDMSLWE